ncbi:MAG: selenocysteine-specific translation elongation factor [Candidatus Hatepunaea meridiana]|nr:selenocysteine-specific translation elongation factor [Candidatus Hatepunaea meridiana]
MSQTHTVICTAGHIDHGKSSLMVNLTGYNPDVLREEQEREMTIELGFVFYGDDVTFIDVPGHEKFLKTMLAGVSSVDGAILVIAADDGVMPQTREHFEILQLLGIKQGIIALTKIDLVDEEWRELITEDILELIKGTFLENAPILPVSNRTGNGMEEFKIALDKLIASARPRYDRGLFRMWLDRAFTIKGSGTIVAGTVLSGRIKVGDRVDILPSGINARVKRIQVHKSDVKSGIIGERTALNLPGINKNDVNRGDLLATPDHYRPTYMLNARLNLLGSVAKPLENRTRLRLHLGSSEHIGRVIMLERQPIEPGRSGLVQFRLEDQAMADIGDRYVIRSFSEGRVLGGGALLEIHPHKLKYAEANDLKRLQRLETAEPREIVKQYLQRVGEKTSDASTLAKELAFQISEIIDIISSLRRDGEVRILQSSPKWQVADGDCYNRLREEIVAFLSEFHRKQPHVKGVRRSDLRSRLMPDAAPILSDTLLKDLSSDGIIKVEGEFIWLSDHKISFDPQQEKLKQKISNIYLTRKFNTPDLNELSTELKLKPAEVEPILVGLCELGELIRLRGPDGKPFHFHKDAITKARQILLDYFKDNNELRFFEFRELIGSSRKYTTPILMHFDDVGITYRDGEVRRLRSLE